LHPLFLYKNISQNGKYIGVRTYYKYFINLYLLVDTFYELWYFRPTNEIEKIEKLDDEKKLNLYIEQMIMTDKSINKYQLKK
jgi:hypothetical protein